MGPDAKRNPYLKPQNSCLPLLHSPPPLEYVYSYILYVNIVITKLELLANIYLSYQLNKAFNYCQQLSPLLEHSYK